MMTAAQLQARALGDLGGYPQEPLMSKAQALAAADLLNMGEVERHTGRAWSVRHTGVATYWAVTLLSDEPLRLGVVTCYTRLRAVLQAVLATLE